VIPWRRVGGIAELRQRTLTNLYNARPTWLANAHAALDRAVWAAYGWPGEEVPAEVAEDRPLPYERFPQQCNWIRWKSGIGLAGFSRPGIAGYNARTVERDDANENGFR
jgi:hypothetical protein